MFAFVRTICYAFGMPNVHVTENTTRTVTASFSFDEVRGLLEEAVVGKLDPSTKIASVDLEIVQNAQSGEFTFKLVAKYDLEKQSANLGAQDFTPSCLYPTTGMVLARDSALSAAAKRLQELTRGGQ